MKKTLLRFILTAFVGASTLAVSGQTVIQGMTPKNHRGLTQIAAPAKAPMKAHAFNTINDVYGTYNCQWINNSYDASPNNASSQVTIVRDTNKTDPNAILINNYFAGIALEATVDLANKTITIPVQNTGFTADNGDVWFFMSYYYPLGGYWQASSFKFAVNATLNSDGSIVLDSGDPTYGFGIWAGSDYWSWDIYTVHRRAVWNYAGPVVDYSFTAQMDECVHNNSIDLKINSGADVASMKYNLVYGDYPASDNNLSIVSESAEPIDKAFNGSIKLNKGFNNGLYTLFLMSYDADGNLKNGDAYLLSIIDDEPGEWADFCTAYYTDDIIGPIFNVGNSVLNVDVQYNTMIQNLIRVVEPYTDFYTDSNIHQCNKKHYLYLDASNPNRVVLLTSPLGFAADEDGLILCTSKAQQEREKGTSDDDIEAMGYFGKMETTSRAAENFVITFPQDALLAYFKNDSGTMYRGNSNGNFRLELTSPIPTSIKEIGSDDVKAPVVYYNLQGMRINEPAKGQVVIRRQGNKSEKIVF